MNTIFKPKFFSLLKLGITKKQISSDIMSGIVVGIVALPLAIAFAVASGVSPEKGLVTAIVAGFIISFLGGSRVQIGGPTGAFIVIVYGIVQQYGLDGLFISTVLAGFIMIIFGLLRLGTVLKYFPQPLIVGFTGGIALVIFSTQIPDALGLPLASVPSEFYQKWCVYFQHLHLINWTAFSLTAVTILIIVFSKRFVPKIPGSFIAIVLVTSLVNFFALDVTTIETFFGSIPCKIKFQLPQFAFADLSLYLMPAITIAMLGSIESLLSAVVSDGMIGGKHRSNTELIAQGVANVLTPFLGGIPATGAIARTATNVKNGGRTPISGMVHAVTLLAIMLFLGNWAKLIPMCCLAGILLVVSYNMSEWRSFISIMRGSYFDVIVLLTTFFITIFFGLTLAIEVGVILSAILFMKRMSDISEKRINDVVDRDVIDNYSDLPKGMLIYEISGPLFFASARRYSEALQEAGLRCQVLVIRMRHLSFVDQTGLHNLQNVLSILKHKHIRVLLSGVSGEVREDLLRFGVEKVLTHDSIFDSFDKSIEKAKKILERTNRKENV